MTERISYAANSKPEKSRGRKAPKRITATYLHNAGLHYLEKYSAGSAHFRTVMTRKVKRSCHHHKDQDMQQCIALVDALVETFIRAGLLNDDAYIGAMVASYRRKGLAARMIIQKLGQKGIAADTVQGYLARHDRATPAGEEDGDQYPDSCAELKAAAIFCRKKKLGCFSTAAPDGSDKQLAKLARAGFGFDIARKVLAMDENDIHALLYGGA